jgi:hypothetical protein
MLDILNFIFNLIMAPIIFVINLLGIIIVLTFVLMLCVIAIPIIVAVGFLFLICEILK